MLRKKYLLSKKLVGIFNDNELGSSASDLSWSFLLKCTEIMLQLSRGDGYNLPGRLL